ncbi:DegT/DnrJ/EryC1/StrS family aminotransferase [Starkeya sp. ORNL1]|uniref:DegT/DnrJ/EryC1/StrS family aminotransferase n=1 Tax=Starkeya sp. ORNL1 TaxID=2709380 RepID=UPI00146377E3|nr:DegT/DnrJ/EryC1/StrS family aminotransferase [Starkeya sp. ORNL1]QJP14289.1 DegT/DnrJ/EryC1/StrS family aminotransferase [Starkeya sp. ORNL1]
MINPDLPRIDQVKDSFDEILRNGKITNFGKFVRDFEAKTHEYLGVETVSLSSGTVSLIFGLQALGLQPGEKVIIPSFSFVATAQAVLYAGGIPIFAEVEDDLNVSIDDVERLLSEHDDVGAVIAVHMYGLPAKASDLERIVSAASERRNKKISLIFDAAHAFGSAQDGRRVGSFGDMEVFSLSATKVLVAVEGGLVATKHPATANRIRNMRNYGISSNYNAHFSGVNGKMSEFHAIIGLHNIQHIDELLEIRQVKARNFRKIIAENTQFGLIEWPEDTIHTIKDFTVLVPEESDPGYRDRLTRYLGDNGIETRSYFYPPIHEQEYFKTFSTRKLPQTESLSRRVLTLPFYTSITDEQMGYVTEHLCHFERELS